MSSMVDVPPELCLRIFGCLTERADLWRVLGVCKLWRELGADRSLWREQTLDAAQAMWMVQHHPTPQFRLHLTIQHNVEETDEDARRHDPRWDIKTAATATLLRGAVADARLREGLRRAVNFLSLGGGVWRPIDAPEPFSPWERLIAAFGGSQAVRGFSTDDLINLASVGWLPALEEISINQMDLEPAEIMQTWPNLRALHVRSISNELRLEGEFPSLTTLRQRHSPAGTEFANLIERCRNLQKVVIPFDYDPKGPVLRMTNPRVLRALDVPLSCLCGARMTIRWTGPHWPALTDLKLAIASPFQDGIQAKHLLDTLPKLLDTMPALENLHITTVCDEFLYVPTPPLIGRTAFHRLRSITIELRNLPWLTGPEATAAGVDTNNLFPRVLQSLFESDIDWHVLQPQRMPPPDSFGRPYDRSAQPRPRYVFAGREGPWYVSASPQLFDRHGAIWAEVALKLERCTWPAPAATLA